jgi:ribosomal protein L32
MGQEFARVCAGKVARSKRDAKTFVNSSKEPLRAYECPVCRHWHVGHRTGSNGYPRR